MKSNKTKRLVCIRRPTGYSDFQRYASVQAWAAKRHIPVDIVPLRDVQNYDWDAACCAWAPFRHTDNPQLHDERCACLASLPEKLPIILDMDNPNSLMPAIYNHLQGKRLACRAVRSLDCDPVFELVVPYSHYPVDVPMKATRDVIMLDIHKWEPITSHVHLLALLERFGAFHDKVCAAAGGDVHYFLTSFTKITPYVDAIKAVLNHGFDSRQKNPLEQIGKNLLPPAETREDFLKILSRTRLCVTFHRNLTDMLLFEALANEIPTAILPLSPFESPRHDLDILARDSFEGYASWALRAEQSLVDIHDSDFGYLRNECSNSGSRTVLHDVFMQTWDALWLWGLGDVTTSLAQA